MDNHKPEADETGSDEAKVNDGSTADSADDEGDANEAESERFERPDNLRRRQDWFQKRHGGG